MCNIVGWPFIVCWFGMSWLWKSISSKPVGTFADFDHMVGNVVRLRTEQGLLQWGIPVLTWWVVVGAVTGWWFVVRLLTGWVVVEALTGCGFPAGGSLVSFFSSGRSCPLRQCCEAESGWVEGEGSCKQERVMTPAAPWVGSVVAGIDSSVTPSDLSWGALPNCYWWGPARKILNWAHANT